MPATSSIGRAAVRAAIIALCAAGAQAREFVAEGSDTGAGVGARWVAQGGTGVASANDLHATYYNPAGLAEVEGFEFSVSRQLDATLRKVNFLGVAWRLPLPAGSAWRATLGASYYPRIHARAAGAFEAEEFESLFLRYLLPGLSGTFDGRIDTKTKSHRVALGLTREGSPWSAGVYVERIDCRSTFCGVHAESNGFTTQSTGAVANGVGLGLRWQASPRWTFGASVSDLRTTLDVGTVVTDDAGTRERRDALAFPRKIALGAAWRGAAGLRAALDVDAMRGRYGSSRIDLQTLRAGVEVPAGDWVWRAGALVPLRIESSETGRLKPPFPLAPTAGLGWRGQTVSVDLALYPHAVMSLHEDRPSLAADLSLTLRF